MKMKKLINFIVTLSITLSVTSVPNLSVEAASCNHHFSKETERFEKIDEKKHQRIRTCSKCGIEKRSTQSHAKGNQVSISQKDDKKHNVNYFCTKCNSNYSVEISHTFNNTKTYENVDNSYHNEIRTCKCGYQRKTLKKHTTSSGSCRNCGHSNADGVGAAKNNGNGVCAAFTNKIFNDKWIYSSCPKCGSTSSSFYKRKVIKKNVPIAGGGKITIYHQQVKCNCGNKYWNKCYYEYQ